MQTILSLICVCARGKRGERGRVAQSIHFCSHKIYPDPCVSNCATAAVLTLFCDGASGGGGAANGDGGFGVGAADADGAGGGGGAADGDGGYLLIYLPIYRSV